MIRLTKLILFFSCLSMLYSQANERECKATATKQNRDEISLCNKKPKPERKPCVDEAKAKLETVKTECKEKFSPAKN